jgi:hypothetical protein
MVIEYKNDAETAIQTQIGLGNADNQNVIDNIPCTQDLSKEFRCL